MAFSIHIFSEQCRRACGHGELVPTTANRNPVGSLEHFYSYSAFFSFEIRGSYLQIMNHLKDRYVQFDKSSYLLFFYSIYGPWTASRKSRNSSYQNIATSTFTLCCGVAVTTCIRARVLPDLLLPCTAHSWLEYVELTDLSKSWGQSPPCPRFRRSYSYINFFSELRVRDWSSL